MGEVINVQGWTDKDSRRPEYRQLYEENDFITAYGKHTDLRIAKDGPELAIGAKKDGLQDWGVHGRLQFEFLKERGLKPEHVLLDFGCGTGRLAVKAAPYLNKGNYLGMDISQSAIEECGKRDYGDRTPLFMYSPTGRFPVEKKWKFHFIFAHSVLTHLPPEIVEQLFFDLSQMEFGIFLFTYKPAQENRRSGLKQFQYLPSWLISTASKYGLLATPDPMEWPAGQKTMWVAKR